MAKPRHMETVLTKKELAVLATLPEVIRVLRKFNAERDEIQALMGQVGGNAVHTPGTPPPGPHQAPTVDFAIPVNESPIKRQRREYLESMKNAPERLAKLEQFKPEPVDPAALQAAVDRDFEMNGEGRDA